MIELAKVDDICVHEHHVSRGTVGLQGGLTTFAVTTRLFQEPLTMANLELDLFLCRTDNFGVLVHDPASGATASIDAPEEQPILGALKRRGWTLTHILTTHHHPDHVSANLALKEAFGVDDHRAGQRGKQNPRHRPDDRRRRPFRFCRPHGSMSSRRPGIPPGISASISPTTSSCFPPTRCLRSAAAGCSKARRRRCGRRCRS